MADNEQTPAQEDKQLADKDNSKDEKADQLKKEEEEKRIRTLSETSTASSNMSEPTTSEGGRERKTSTSSTEGRDRSVSSSSIGEGRRRTQSGSSGGFSRCIILAVDASENSKFAFDWFLEHIYKSDDSVVLVHCPEAPRLPTFSFKSGIQPPVDEWKRILDDMNSKTRKLEEDYEGTCIQRKLKYKVKGEAMKNPGEGICKIADEEMASLIVMGTRGLGGIKRTLLGSVSDYVVRNTNVPVVIVPAKRMRRRTMSQASDQPPVPE